MQTSAGACEPAASARATERQIPRYRVGGCPVHALSFADTVAEVSRRIEQRVPTHIVFINAVKVVAYRENAALRGVMDKAELLLPDGLPVVWGSALLGSRLPGRVAGVDLAEALVATAAQRGYRVFFLGAREDVLDAAISALTARHPGLIVAGKRNGYFTPDEEPAILRQINDSRADLLLVGMSTPQKELWVARNMAHLTVPVIQGVGGTFDILAGKTRRAPLWMQRCGLEWFYRFLQEPGRMWRRYLRTNTLFCALVMRDFILRLKPEQPAASG